MCVSWIIMFLFQWVTKSKTALDPLDLKIRQQDISLIKNYCITVSIGRISSIHEFILKMQQILGSHELQDHCNSWPCPPLKSFNQLLAFFNLYQDPKNQFIPSVHFWDTVNFRVLWPDWPHPFFDHVNPINFLSTFNLCESVSTCTKSVYSIWSFFRYSQI